MHFVFLNTLSKTNIRNEIVEILKIFSCIIIATFEIFKQSDQNLLTTHFVYEIDATKVLIDMTNIIIRQNKVHIVFRIKFYIYKHYIDLIYLLCI